MRAVLVSYDGVCTGPGRSQTVPYVRGLRARGHEVALLSYERPEHIADAARVRAVEEDLAGARWERLPWRRSALRDLAAGLVRLRRVAREQRADLVHARGYVPALLARAAGRRYVFDMRGFWPDERADAGHWRRDALAYRTWKRIERALCARAGAVVVLSERARDELRRLHLVPEPRPVHVVPTCTDLARFRPLAPTERSPETWGGAARYVMLGGTGTWYLPEAMFDFAARALARDATAVLHVLTPDAPEPLRDALARRRVPVDRALVRDVAHADVPQWIAGAAAGIALLRATWSKAASCPTKLGEFLACGVPVVMSSGIGDVDRLFAAERVGVAVPATDGASLDAALDALDVLRAEGPALAARCRAVAERRFALDVALDVYERAYAEAAA